MLFFSTPLLQSEQDWQDLFDAEENYIPEDFDCIDASPSRAIIPKDAAVILLTNPNGVPPILAQNILKNPLYYRSNPPIRRNVIDLPIFQQFTKRGRTKTSYSFNPFFNQTFKEYFFDHRHDIQYYLDMKQSPLDTQVDLITQLDDLEFLPRGFQVSRILTLFESIFLEERKVGGMFEFIKDTPHWTFSGRVPFLYTEHNLNMPEEDREKVERDPFFAGDGFDEMAFARQHLISDRIGIGDLRLNYEYLLIDNHAQIFSLGAKATIPTAFAFKKGLYGSRFPATTPDPDFDLYTDLLKPALSTDADNNIPLAQQNIINFGYQVMDRLSAIVLEAPSGNNHHLGIGIFTHNKMIFSPHWSLEGITSAEILLPAHEHRFFILNTDVAAFNAFDWNDISPATGQLQAKLDFLNKQFIQKFFPTMYNVLVFPGLIFQSTTGLFYKGRRADLAVGTDLYWRTKERFMSVDAPAQVKATLLDYKTARTRYALQSSLWMLIEKHASVNSSWKLGVKGEVTSNSFGIGEDWAASLLIQKEF